MRQAARHALLALQFFTRVRLPARLGAWVGYNDAMQRASMGYFPLVGWLVGAVVAAVLWGALRVLPPVGGSVWLAVVLALVAGVALTGALHEDALADTADALGVIGDRERALVVMKDPHMGVFGVLALLLSFGTKVAAWGVLVQATLQVAPLVLLAAHVVSRWAAVAVLVRLPYVRAVNASRAPALAQPLPAGVWMVATGWLLPVLGLVLLRPAIAWVWALVAACLAGWWLFRWQKRALQGCTGDTLGATQQLVEIALVLGFVLGWGVGG